MNSASADTEEGSQHGKQTEARVRTYYYPDYIKNKEEIQRKIDSEAEKKVAFKNSIMIKTMKVRKVKEIIDVLKSHDKECVKSILTAMPYRSSKVWIFEFKNDINLKDFIGVFGEGDEKIVCSDPNLKTKEVVTLKGTLRIHWLNPSSSNDEIKDFLENRIINSQVDGVEDEYHSEIEGIKIKNGTRKVKITFYLSEINTVTGLIGFQEIDGQKCLVQLNGYPPKCHSCGKIGHLALVCQNKAPRSYAKVHQTVNTQEELESESNSYELHENTVVQKQTVKNSDYATKRSLSISPNNSVSTPLDKKQRDTDVSLDMSTNSLLNVEPEVSIANIVSSIQQDLNFKRDGQKVLSSDSSPF